MIQVWIVGAGGFGREVLTWLDDATLVGVDEAWTVAGFLDANPNALAPFGVDLPIVSSPKDYTPQPQDRFVCGIGSVRAKLAVCRDLQERGAQFVTLIHRSALVGKRVTMGLGCVICPRVVLTADIQLSQWVVFNVASGAGHDVVVGEGTTISGVCDLTGGAQLGEGVFLGSHAIVMPKVKVGDYATLGAGSVAFRDVPPYTTVMGVPAKTIFRAKD